MILKQRQVAGKTFIAEEGFEDRRKARARASKYRKEENLFTRVAYDRFYKQYLVFHT